MLLRIRRTPPGFIQPCLPSPADHPPSGPAWVHEIKHDGFRLMARPDCVWLFTRNGVDWSQRFPLIAEAVGALPVKSFLVDGEAVAVTAMGCRCSTDCATAVRTEGCFCTPSTCWS